MYANAKSNNTHTHSYTQTHTQDTASLQQAVEWLGRDLWPNSSDLAQHYDEDFGELCYNCVCVSLCQQLLQATVLVPMLVPERARVLALV